MVFSGGATYPTARLVWATPVPKGRWSMFPRNRHASRVTPSQVNSRPSVCLSSYLLQGRNVMLEVMRVAKSEGLPNNVGTKLIAHTLIAHGGHIYIHANDIGPHNVLDSQDVREKTKLKRAANLRISDFISLIKECTLRIPNESEKQTSMTPSNILCAQPRQHLLRLTRYWPLRSDQCFIYNIPKRFDTLFTIIRQPQLSTVDADKCRQVIHQLTTLRDSKERLTETWVDTILLRDGTDREEQFQVAFEEIARHLGNYTNHSDRHKEIFQLFAQLTGLERMAKVLTSDVVLTDRTRGQDAATVNSTLQTAFVPPSAPSETRNLSRSNSPPPKKSRKACYLWKPSETLNLYDYLMEKEERHHRTHWVDFVGRVKAGNRPAHLYPNLEATATTAKQD
ncbi:hypothetical protein Angca_008224 [Angiostrongylus cantonensis]|nr:hypothetical protein Angca_008224 [Angiostrongylus cantonensis]